MTKRDSGKAVRSNKPIQATTHELLWGRAGFLVRRLHQIHVTMFLEECASETVTPVQFGVLTVLSDGAKLDQATLGMEVGIDRTNIGDVVSRLEKRGLVKRQTDPADRRVRLVSIKPKGRALVGQLVDKVEKAQARLIERLSAEEREAFLRLLRKLVEANNEQGRTVLRASAE